MADPAITQLLKEACVGNRDAFNDLLPLVYEDLRVVAHRRLGRFKRADTLNTTALIHEAYLRLVDQTQVTWQDRAHFFAVASRAMRNVIIDYARACSAEKRGGGERPVRLDDVQISAEDRAFEILALDEALEHLMKQDERLAQLVEYRFFGGLNYEEIAEATGWSVPTLKRDWKRARTWLYHFMRSGNART